MAPCPIVCERVHFHNVKGREEHTKPEVCFMNHSLSSEEEDAIRQISKYFWESQPIEQPAVSHPCFIRAGCFLPTKEGELPLTPIYYMTDSHNSLYTAYSSLAWELCCWIRKPYVMVCLGVWAWMRSVLSNHSF